METMAWCVLAVALVAALNVIGPRLNVAPQIILVAAGAALSFLPGTGLFALNPAFVMMGLLPLLLYAASLALPTIEFRRDLGAIGGLSVVLVIVTATALGWIIHWLAGVPLAIGVALGALLSPTDAAAIGLVKKLGLSPRVVAILDGESLLNDASALVLLRAGLAAVATGFSLPSIAKGFVFAVVAAGLIGYLVGRLGLTVRRHIANPAIATVVSFLVPFCAYLPADLVGASGLVAVVAAGLTTRQLGPRRLGATQRLTETVNWRTVEFLAEGVVFLGLGAQVKGLLVTLWDSDETLGTALLVSAVAWVVALLVRGGYLAVIIASVKRSTARKAWRRDQGQARLKSRQADGRSTRPRFADDHPELVAQRFARLHAFMRRFSADVDYLVREPLRAREGTLLTWAGLRGVVTVAGAQTLPLNLPHRPLIVLIAFIVAVGSLLVQGLSLGAVARRLGLTQRETHPGDEWSQLQAELNEASLAVLDDDALRRGNGQPYSATLISGMRQRLRSFDRSADSDDPSQFRELRLALIAAQRAALLRMQSVGEYTSGAMQRALTQLDAGEISLTLSDEE